jgi:hypothetical protein
MNLFLIDLGGAALEANTIDTITKSYFFYNEHDYNMFNNSNSK